MEAFNSTGIGEMVDCRRLVLLCSNATAKRNKLLPYGMVLYTPHSSNLPIPLIMCPPHFPC